MPSSLSRKKVLQKTSPESLFESWKDNLQGRHAPLAAFDDGRVLPRKGRTSREAYWRGVERLAKAPVAVWVKQKKHNVKETDEFRLVAMSALGFAWRLSYAEFRNLACTVGRFSQEQWDGATPKVGVWRLMRESLRGINRFYGMIGRDSTSWLVDLLGSTSEDIERWEVRRRLPSGDAEGGARNGWCARINLSLNLSLNRSDAIQDSAMQTNPENWKMSAQEKGWLCCVGGALSNPPLKWASPQNGLHPSQIYGSLKAEFDIQSHAAWERLVLEREMAVQRDRSSDSSSALSGQERPLQKETLSQTRAETTESRVPKSGSTRKVPRL